MTGSYMIGAFFAGVLLLGCAKENNSAQATPVAPEASAAMEAQFLPSTNRGGATIQDRLEGSVHPELTARLRLFIDTHGRLPENFYEFSNRSMDSVPALPSGMKFEIDPSDKTVKAVKK